MSVERRSLDSFEFFHYLYLNGCDIFLYQDWFSNSVEFQYSRLVFTLVKFLLKNGKEKLNNFPSNLYFDIINFVLNIKCEYSNFDLNFNYLHELGNNFEELLQNVSSSNVFEIEKFKQIKKLEPGNKKHIIYSVCWISINFYKSDFVEESTQNLDFVSMIHRYLNLAYIVDHITWDSIVSDYIFMLKNKGFVRTDLLDIKFNDELQSLFFILINPYNICPSLCTLLLLLKGKIEDYRPDLIEYNLAIRKTVERILFLFSKTLENVSPDLAELSFTITVCRMLTAISEDIQTEFIEQLFELKFSQISKGVCSIPIAPSFIDRFILNSFSTIEQLWCEITKDESFFQSILTNIPSYELSITILSFKTSNIKLSKTILLLFTLFSVNNGLTITGDINENTLKILKEIVEKEENNMEKVIKFFLFLIEDDYLEKSCSSFKLKWTLNFLSSSVSNPITSINIIRSMVNLIQINDIITLSDDFLYRFLESFPNLIKLCNNNIVKDSYKKFNMKLMDFISNTNCFFICNLFWCNSNIIQVILSNLSIEIEHIASFIYYLSLSISSIQKKIDEYEFNISHHSDKITQKCKINSIEFVDQINVKKFVSFLMKTKNLDHIIITILDFLSDWFKKNEHVISIELMIKEMNEKNVEILDIKLRENLNRYISIFFLYLYSKVLESDKLDKFEIIKELHNVPWRGSFRWIVSWDRIFSFSVLNSRFWQVIFSERMAILIPESFIIPNPPNNFSDNLILYLTLENTFFLKNKLIKWFFDRKKLIDFFENNTRPLFNSEVALKIRDSTSEWLKLFYLEPNMTLYLSIEILFLQKETKSRNVNFPEFYFEICFYENKVKDFITSPESYFGENAKYLFGKYSLEILCNVSLTILYIHEVIKHRRSSNIHPQNIDYEVFCIIWNKIVVGNGIENKLVNKQFSIFLTNLTNRNTNVVQQIIENGLQYKYEDSNSNFNTYLRDIKPLVAIFCQNTPQLLKEHTILPKIANKLDKLLNTKLVSEIWGKYDVMKRDNIPKEDSEIENQIISCVLLLLWLCNIIVEPSSTNCNITESSNENVTFLPVAERSVVRVICITQELISSKFENKFYNNLLNNFTIFLKFSTPFITSISSSFPQLTQALKDTISSLKQLMSDQFLINSKLHQIINSIDELL